MNKIIPLVGMIILNFLCVGVIISESIQFRGVELYGVSKNALAFFGTFGVNYAILSTYNDYYKFITFNTILSKYIFSPFFIIWMFSLFYFPSAKIWLKYVPFMSFTLFIIIYFSMLLSLFYFYNKLINKLELLNEQNKPVNEQGKSKKKKHRKKKKHTTK